MRNESTRYDRIEGLNTYRAKVTGFAANGGGKLRTRTFLVPGKDGNDAEARARRQYGPASGGYNVQIKKVANYWRESKE